MTPPRPSIATVRERAARVSLERELAEAGVPVATAQTDRWMRLWGRDGVLLVARDDAGRPRHGVGASIGPSRALPGHRVYRVERLGASTSPADDAAIVAAVARLARDDPRCLRMTVEVFERDAATRARLVGLLRGQGFSRVTAPRMYERTVALDLVGSDDDLFAAIDKTARRHVRAPAKRGLELRPVADPAWAPRIEALLDATFKRTGGLLHHLPWSEIIAWSVESPATSRVVGLFDPRTEGPESLVSMAWGCMHGDHGTYEAGAGIRRPDLGSTPLNYAPLWDLITWSRREGGARWFDLGGASAGDASDPLAGNLEFKRYFSQQLVDVAEEWQLEPHAGRAALARAIAAVARWTSRLRSGMRSGGGGA